MRRQSAFVRTSAGSREVVAAEVPIPAAGEHELLAQLRAFGVGIDDRTSSRRTPYSRT
jgi:hypothetical protein